MNDPYPQEVCDMVTVMMVRRHRHDKRYCHTALDDQGLMNLHLMRAKCLCKTTSAVSLRIAIFW